MPTHVSNCTDVCVNKGYICNRELDTFNRFNRFHYKMNVINHNITLSSFVHETHNVNTVTCSLSRISYKYQPLLWLSALLNILSEFRSEVVDNCKVDIHVRTDFCMPRSS